MNRSRPLTTLVAAFLVMALSHAGVAKTFTVLHRFGQNTDAANPQSGFVYRDGILYGTTLYGGTSFGGTTYTIDLASGRETILHSFGASADGIGPYAGLTLRDGLLYGTTLQGGRANRGTIVRVDPASGRTTTLSDFDRTPSYGGSLAELTNASGWLVGTSSGGGAADAGTIFGYSPTEKRVHTFYAFKGGSDGAYAYSRLLYHSGELYGTTAGGGADNNGTIFKINPWTGVETVLYRFKGNSDGRGPRSGVVFHRGRLYGTTPFGGGTGCRGIGCGLVYSFDPLTAEYRVVYRFRGGQDGATPYAPLLVFRGNLYGTTAAGGQGCGVGCGTIFNWDVAGEREIVAYRFRDDTDGQYPVAPLTECGGALCGTTTSGSTYYNGTAFRFEP